MKIDIVDLEENLQYLDQYIELRNSFTDKLLCEKVTMQDTKEWIKNTQLCIKIATQNSLILGVVILYMDKENEITVFVKEQNKGLGNLLLLEIEKFIIFFKIDKELTFINCVEYHKSFIPHMHLLLFVKPELVDKVKQRFLSTIQKYQLTRTDFQVIDNDFNIEIVSSYIRKYMFKSLTLKDDTQDVKTNKLTENRKFDGYLKLFKIRQFRMNQLKLSLEIYNKVYYSLNKEFKTKIIEKITPLKKSLFQFIMENIKITKRVISVSSLTLQQSQFSLNNTPKIFEVIVNSIKKTTTSKVVNLLIYQTIDDEKRLIYNKQDFQVLTI